MDDESEKMKNLQEELEDSQQKLIQAAEFGKMLLEQNEELQEHMEDLRKSYDRKLEFAEQERHELQVKLDQKCSMVDWYSEEITHMKQQLADGQDNLRETLEADRQEEVSKLNRKIDELKADLDQANVIESHLKQKISQLEDLLKERLNKTEADLGSRSFGLEDNNALQEEVERLEFEVTTLKSELIEKKSELSSVLSELENLRGRLHARDEELDDIRCQFTSVNNTLEQARMEKLDLKCQLDALRMETNSHRKKGNSIFSELDDRRVDAEKRVIQLQLSNESLKEKYNVEKQQNNKYKIKISQLLLEMSTGRMDSDYVNDLESKLSQARQELKIVMVEKTKLQETQQQCKTELVSENEQGKMVDSEYTHYLKTLIEGKDQELKKLKHELNFKNLQLLDERSQTSTLNAGIKRIEVEKDKLRSQNIKMAAKLEELQLKYEPESLKKSGVLVVKKSETIPLDGPDEVSIIETSDRSVINRLLQSSHPRDQSQLSSHSKEKQAQPLAETVVNVPKKPEFQESRFSTFSKSKKVTISDDVEEFEIEKLEGETTSENKPPRKQKGRTLTEVKCISTEKSKNAKDVNECKSQ